MDADADTHRLLTLCSLEFERLHVDWSLIAREAARYEGLDRMYAGDLLETSVVAEKSLPILRAALSEDLDRARARVDQELASAADVGADLVTVLDERYPINLRLIPNLPPFLFTLGGEVTVRDVFSVAVVGTRKPTDQGVQQAARLARQLVERGVTVVSGLAAGIDTAAHIAALDAGGRTIAVVGTGVTRTYPKENAGLSERIARDGVVVSQFWPSSPPASWSFPRRNVVTSGISQGTAVIEASSTSGAKMQARIALEHGKRVFLLRGLVTSQPWAQKYLSRRGAVEVRVVDDVLAHLSAPERVRASVDGRHQLTLDLL